MIDWFNAGGFFMWPVLVSGLMAVALAVDTGRRLLAGPGGSARRGEWWGRRIDAVLFWGGFAAIVGTLGTLGGIAQMADVLQASGGAPAGLVWSGIRLSLITAISGLAVLLLSLGLWFGLRLVHRRRVEA